MKDKVNNWYKEQIKKMEIWSHGNILGLFVFNMMLIFLLLLRSAGYFTPYLELDINIIVLISLICAVFLLKVREGAIFVVAISFWIFAAFLRTIEVSVWAERTAIYAYESLFVGIVIMMVEVIAANIRKNEK